MQSGEEEIDAEVGHEDCEEGKDDVDVVCLVAL